MPQAETPALIGQFFKAMQTGASSEQELVALFHDEAVYIEPFSGARRVHRGKGAVREALARNLKTPLPDLRIVLERVDVDGETVTVDWTCHSPALPGGSGQGTDTFRIKEGRIVRLETVLKPRS